MKISKHYFETFFKQAIVPKEVFIFFYLKPKKNHNSVFIILMFTKNFACTLKVILKSY